ncbi:MAG: hypothetical protein ACJ8H8_27265 [Geminicoccaceae bacterium]
MLRRAAVVLLLVMGTSVPAMAETLVEKVNETRTYLYFRVADQLAQAVLPPGWRPTAVPQGPAKGANLILVLIDRLLATDAERKPLEPATNRMLVIVLPGRDTASDAAGPVVIGGISAEARGAPGAYRTYVAGKIELARSARDGSVDEDWQAESPDGDRLTLALSYTQGVPTLLTFDQKTYSGADPSFYRIYRGDWGVDVARSSVTGVDRVTRLELTGRGPLLGKLLDGSQELVNVSAVPWYRRDAFLP